MPGRKPLAAPSDLAYLYDGGLKGFYCCVFESVYSRQLPLCILSQDAPQTTLLPQRWIDTDEGKARRVREAVAQKISKRAQELVETVFLSCLVERELVLLRFLLMAFVQGRQATNMLTHPDVATLLKAERHLQGEAHLLKGFVRFSDYEGALVATIRPKNFALPFIADHFIQRYSEENFMIFDRTHEAALLYESRQGRIVPMSAFSPPAPSQEETLYRALWKRFYQTIAIEARENPRCRMSHMPKRYWSEMTEMQP